MPTAFNPHAPKRKALGPTIDANSLDMADQGLKPGWLTLICVLSAALKDTCPCEECQQLHAAGLTLTVPVREEDMASCKWPLARVKLPPLPGHPYLSKNFVSGSQRFLYPVTPETPGKSPRSFYQGLSLPTPSLRGRWEHSPANQSLEGRDVGMHPCPHPCLKSSFP